MYGNVDKIHGSAGCDERGLSMQNRSYLKSIFFRKVIEQEDAKSPLLALTTPARANCFGWGCSLCEMTFEASSCSLCKMTLNHLLYKYEQTCSNTNLIVTTIYRLNNEIIPQFATNILHNNKVLTNCCCSLPKNILTGIFSIITA